MQLSCTVPKQLCDWSTLLRLEHFRTGVYRANHVTGLTKGFGLRVFVISIANVESLVLIYQVDVHPAPAPPPASL